MTTEADPLWEVMHGRGTRAQCFVQHMGRGFLLLVRDRSGEVLVSRLHDGPVAAYEHAEALYTEYIEQGWTRVSSPS